MTSQDGNEQKDRIPGEESATLLNDQKRNTLPGDLPLNYKRPHEPISRGELGFCRRATLDVGNLITTKSNFNLVTDRNTDTVALELNQIHAETIDDIKTHAEPIVGYAAEPLLPLVKACGPLNNIIHDLPSYVQLALHETPETPPDQLTVDESAAIRLYTMEWEEPHRSLYSMLNHTLKRGTREELRPYFKYMKLFMTALIKLPCSPSLTVWRGVTKNLSAEFPPNTPVTWWSFSSCTTALSILENNMYLGKSGERTLFSVEAINGRTIRNHSHFVTEDEILLLPGTHMIVQSQFSPAPELQIIHLKQVEPDEILLEPPFEGIIETSHIIFFFLFEILSSRCQTLS